MVSKILPRLLLDSMSVCALSASARSKWAKVVVRNFGGDEPKSGHAVRVKSEATSDLNSSQRDLKVEPVRLRRFSITGIRSISISALHIMV